MLSTGSISPISFYNKRGFGIKRFENIVNDSNLNNIIVLFKKFPLFRINSDKESYPMVVEIDLEEAEVNKSNIDGVFYVCHTLYFSPNNITFFFNSEIDEKKAKLRVQQSDEAKFLNLYKNSFCIKSDKIDSFELSQCELGNISIEDDCNVEQEIHKDFLHDKLRGILCGFFIGANDFDNPYADKWKVHKNFEQLLSLFHSDKELYDDTYKLQQKAYYKYCENLSQLFSIDANGITLLPQEDKDHQNFYVKLLERLLDTKEEISPQYISREGGKLLKSLYRDGWEFSSDRNYLTKLLNNVTYYDDFNIGDTDSIILRSFAAFVQRGLGEWEKLKDYLDERMREIPNRRYIYGLFGAVNGFSTISKTLTDTTSIPNDVLTEFITGLNNLVRNDIRTNFIVKETYLHGGDVQVEKVFVPNITNKITNPVLSQIPSWKQEAKIYIERNISVKKKKEKALEILADTSISTAEQFLQRLQNCKGWTKGKTINCLKKLLHPQNDLFPDKEDNNVTLKHSYGLSMFDDRNWWEETAQMITDSKARKQYLTDVKWFIENHNQYYNDKKKGSIKGYYYEYPTENARLLERFRVYLQNKLKPNPKAQWIAAEYAKVPIESIIKYLTSHYAN